MTDVRVTTADTPARREDAFAVRRVVFVDEQDVDEAIEWDDWDDHDATTHFVAYADRTGSAGARVDGSRDRTGGTDARVDAAAADVAGEDRIPVGAARLRPKDPDVGVVGKVERVAVLDTHRDRGIGRALMEELEAHGRERGFDAFYLHSQTHAAEFYAGLGYERRGDEFDEAGIPHVEMRKDVTSRQQGSDAASRHQG